MASRAMGIVAMTGPRRLSERRDRWRDQDCEGRGTTMTGRRSRGVLGLAKARGSDLGQADKKSLTEPAMVGMSSVGRMRDRLRLHRGIRDPFQVLGLEGAGLMRDRNALLDEHHEVRLAQPLAPARQRVSDDRSNGSSCRNIASPQKNW